MKATDTAIAIVAAKSRPEALRRLDQAMRIIVHLLRVRSLCGRSRIARLRRSSHRWSR